MAVGHPLQAQSTRSCGVMVMAHGGSDIWNAAVEKAVRPLRDYQPTEIAFGMANPATMQDALMRLEEKRVACIAVVRLFASAKSFLHQTEFLLGQRSDPPPFFIRHGDYDVKDPSPLRTESKILVSKSGLLDAAAMGGILAERARELSDESGLESVLILAHGPGRDAENDEWLRKLDRLADSVRAAGAFKSVAVQTLREDWDDKRVVAEKKIRSFVNERTNAGERVLVIPFRLFGFGPYAEVLDDLTYYASGKGLLPSTAVTAWIQAQADILMADETGPPIGMR